MEKAAGTKKKNLGMSEEASGGEGNACDRASNGKNYPVLSKFSIDQNPKSDERFWKDLGNSEVGQKFVLLGRPVEAIMLRKRGPRIEDLDRRVFPTFGNLKERRN